MARLCYDTPSVEAMPFPVALPDKTPLCLGVRLLSGKMFGEIVVRCCACSYNGRRVH
jgi:hypothetical protein